MRAEDIFRRQFRVALVCLIAATIAGGVVYYVRGGQRLPYHDSFSSGSTGEWHGYGGSWEIYDGAIRNNSDERGAKLVAGSPEWRDYSVETDVLLLGQNGDAGVIVRSSDEEDGVDSYSGYYVGLRDSNNTVAIGRADHGWMEYQAVSVKSGVHPLHWYHLRVVVVGCEIAALASDPETQQNTVAVMHEEGCARIGRIGLRSYSSGGLWKNIRVVEANQTDLKSITQGAQIAYSPALMQTEAGFNSLLPYVNGKAPGPTDLSPASHSMNIHTPPLNSLRLVSDLQPPQVTVRGSVVLTSPVLYIEDSSGGLAIDSPKGPSLRIGDEVEVTGIAESRRFSGILKHAAVRLLWSREPAPPLSVTASQATTGTFDGMFVEVEGRLEDKARVAEHSVVLDLKSGHQSYRAILNGARQDDVFARLQPNSLLRLRGVCVVDPEYTKSLTPFVLLLRSSEDVGIVAGPPWWDLRHLLEIGFALMILTLIGVLIYTRAEHWRIRAVLEERSRMAREIHDTLAQGFAGIALQLESALHESKPGNITVGPVGMALQMARQSRREAHRSIAALRTLHTDQPLTEMLQKVLRPQVAGTSLDLSFSSSGSPQRLSGECEGQVLRIAQEAVANTIQHAMATRINVRLVFGPDALEVEMVDNGQGFEVSVAPAAEEGHFGITGMQERAMSIQAKFTIQSDNCGTRISLLVPIHRHRTLLWKSAPLWTRRFKTQWRPRSG